MSLLKNVVLAVLGGLIIVPSALNAQRKKKNKKVVAPVIMETQVAESPKLVVGIVVDQMRYDYLTRFWGHYTQGGFKRMVREGFNCKNNHYNYAPTSTGPGHASVYTGTTPATHGIIGNNWYSKAEGKSVYCAGDPSFTSVGSNADDGKMSPHRMQVTTMTDELRLHTQKRGKVIAMSIKDRGAVLPGGHMANAAYWFRGKSDGHWITSSFYMDALPNWVAEYNQTHSVSQYKRPWTTVKDIAAYQESGTDKNNYEGLFEGEEAAVFPHDLPALWDANGGYDILKATAFGNSLLADFAIAALDGESLGTDADTDFLAVSFSSTDYVGHKYGVNSKEVQDTYVRLDQDLERFFNALDSKVGKGNYTVFLTADHAAIDVPAYLADERIPAGYIDEDKVMSEFDEYLKYNFGTTDIVKASSNNQLFLDHKIIENLDLELSKVQEMMAKELVKHEGIEKTFTANQLWSNNYTRGLGYILQNGYHQKRSGDVFYVLSPGTIDYPKTGSTHGSPQIYDTHVPLLFMGKGIRNGATAERTEIVDAAPTISVLLGMAFPSGTTGKPVAAALK
ncbi:alkaline phosphatase PafA [Sediminicola luteus]|uniref:Alkaline phosphatase n=1 Tax=Sediminicola luteus TaxID=319238 RepID=A0A2A4G812_9FLAO|nr:alkaline phosphatase PafA [Sediminicola luteus]PCE64573.1 alkaline phosphatase [Sediminicola luteus]